MTDPYIFFYFFVELLQTSSGKIAKGRMISTFIFLDLSRNKAVQYHF